MDFRLQTGVRRGDRKLTWKQIGTLALVSLAIQGVMLIVLAVIAIL